MYQQQQQQVEQQQQVLHVDHSRIVHLKLDSASHEPLPILLKYSTLCSRIVLCALDLDFKYIIDLDLYFPIVGR